MWLAQTWCTGWRVWSDATDSAALAPKRTRKLFIFVDVATCACGYEGFCNHVFCEPEQSVLSAAATLWAKLQAQCREVAAKLTLTTAPSTWLFAEPHGARATFSSAADLAAQIESLLADHHAKLVGCGDDLEFQLELANSVWAVQRDPPVAVLTESVFAEDGLRLRRA